MISTVSQLQDHKVNVLCTPNFSNSGEQRLVTEVLKMDFTAFGACPENFRIIFSQEVLRQCDDCPMVPSSTQFRIKIDD